MKLTINAKAQSWNFLIGKHYRVVKAVRDELKIATLSAIRRANALPIDAKHYPLFVHIHFKWKQKRKHDIDSVAVKSVLDQLVKSRIIKDDSLAYIGEVAYTGETGCKEDQITIELSSLKAKHKAI